MILSVHLVRRTDGPLFYDHVISEIARKYQHLQHASEHNGKVGTACEVLIKDHVSD